MGIEIGERKGMDMGEDPGGVLSGWVYRDGLAGVGNAVQAYFCISSTSLNTVETDCCSAGLK